MRKHLSSEYALTNLVHRESSVEDLNYVVVDALHDYDGLRSAFSGQDVVVHLAITREEPRRLNNLAMTMNVYKAASETEVSRVIMASSIHAAGGYWGGSVSRFPTQSVFSKKPVYRHIANRDFAKVKEIPLITVDALPYPDSVYGATKVFMEALGRYYADMGLSVVCIRFGGVNEYDSPLKGPENERGYHSIWFSHRDLSQLVKKCIDSSTLPPFSIFFGVSNNRYCILDTSNSREQLGYAPVDDAESFYENG
jgi:uronate dehydrogenase